MRATGHRTPHPRTRVYDPNAEERVQFTVTLPVVLRDRALATAGRIGLTMTDLIRAAVVMYTDEVEAGETFFLDNKE